MKKYYKIVLPVLTCSLFGCSTPKLDTAQESSNAASSELSSTTDNSSNPYDDYIDPQIQVIVENRDVWNILYEDGPGDPVTSPYSFFYITDFDHNGRLEITASENQGSGVYTSAYVYEVNSDFSGIDVIDENYDAPEYVFENIKTFYNEVDQTYIYISELIIQNPALYGETV